MKTLCLDEGARKKGLKSPTLFEKEFKKEARLLK